MNSNRTITVLCILLFINVSFTSAGISEPTINGWTYSENLSSGSYMRWQVTMTNGSVDNPQPVTVPLNDGPNFVDGSIIEIWIEASPNGLQFDNEVNNKLGGYFDLKIDGNPVIEPELLTGLIFPNTYLTDIGDYNYFQYIKDFNKNLTFFDNVSENNTISQSFVPLEPDLFHAEINIFREDNINVTEQFEYHVSSGILDGYYRYEFYPGFEAFTLGLILTTYEEGDGYNDFFRNGSFDSSLNIGDEFTWKVTTLKDNGVDVTSSDPGEPVLNSIIKIKVVGEPENMNISDPTVNPEDYFELTLDENQISIQDVFDGPGDFAQFIFPYHFDFGNGTSFNFFTESTFNPQNVWEDTSDISASISQGVFYLTISETNGSNYTLQNYQFDFFTGVMLSMEQRQDEGANILFELRIERVVEAPSLSTGSSQTPSTTTTPTPSNSDQSSNGDVPVPGFGLFALLPIFWAILIYTKKKIRIDVN